MKREEIEQLLAEYVNGKISVENQQVLEKLFANDPALKQEADEMLALWQMMDNSVVEENNDEQFYDMLKAEQNTRPTPIIKLVPWWFYATAVAACIVVFFAGRFTTTPVEIIKYKTLIVNQQVPVPQQVVQIASLPATPKLPVNEKLAVKKRSKTEVEVPSALAQQLRSVYASERIAAVMSLTGNKNIAPADLKILEIALREDTNPNVKLTIINVLQPLANQQNVQNLLIRALNTQEDATTQSSLIDVLVNARSKQALPQMIALLDNKNTSAMVQDKIRDEIKRFAY